MTSGTLSCLKKNGVELCSVKAGHALKVFFFLKKWLKSFLCFLGEILFAQKGYKHAGNKQLSIYLLS